MNSNFFIFSMTWLPALAWAGLIFFLSNIPSLNSGLGVWDFVLRKLAHMFEYAVLTGLLIRAFAHTWSSLSRNKLMAWSGILSLLYAMSDEFHQRFVPGRGGSARDVIIDACGIGLFLATYYLWTRRHRS